MQLTLKVRTEVLICQEMYDELELRQVTVLLSVKRDLWPPVPPSKLFIKPPKSALDGKCPAT